jgi:hypothetical protein
MLEAVGLKAKIRKKRLFGDELVLRARANAGIETALADGRGVAPADVAQEAFNECVAV